MGRSNTNEYIFERYEEPMRSACELCLTMDMSPKAEWIGGILGGALAFAICKPCIDDIKRTARTAPEEPTNAVPRMTPAESLQKAREAKAEKKRIAALAAPVPQTA